MKKLIFLLISFTLLFSLASASVPHFCESETYADFCNVNKDNSPRLPIPDSDILTKREGIPSISEQGYDLVDFVYWSLKTQDRTDGQIFEDDGKDNEDRVIYSSTTRINHVKANYNNLPEDIKLSLHERPAGWGFRTNENGILPIGVSTYSEDLQIVSNNDANQALSALDYYQEKVLTDINQNGELKLSPHNGVKIRLGISPYLLKDKDNLYDLSSEHTDYLTVEGTCNSDTSQYVTQALSSEESLYNAANSGKIKTVYYMRGPTTTAHGVFGSRNYIDVLLDGDEGDYLSIDLDQEDSNIAAFTIKTGGCTFSSSRKIDVGGRENYVAVGLFGYEYTDYVNILNAIEAVPSKITDTTIELNEKASTDLSSINQKLKSAGASKVRISREINDDYCDSRRNYYQIKGVCGFFSHETLDADASGNFALSNIEFLTTNYEVNENRTTPTIFKIKYKKSTGFGGETDWSQDAKVNFLVKDTNQEIQLNSDRISEFLDDENRIYSSRYISLRDYCTDSDGDSIRYIVKQNSDVDSKFFSTSRLAFSSPQLQLINPSNYAASNEGVDVEEYLEKTIYLQCYSVNDVSKKKEFTITYKIKNTKQPITISGSPSVSMSDQVDSQELIINLNNLDNIDITIPSSSTSTEGRSVTFEKIDNKKVKVIVTHGDKKQEFDDDSFTITITTDDQSFSKTIPISISNDNDPITITNDGTIRLNAYQATARDINLFELINNKNNVWWEDKEGDGIGGFILRYDSAKTGKLFLNNAELAIETDHTLTKNDVITFDPESNVVNTGLNFNVKLIDNTTESSESNGQINFFININDLNEPPIIELLSNEVITEENEATTFGFSISDPENDQITLEITNINPITIPSQSFTIDQTNNQITFVPPLNYNGELSISVSASDEEFSPSIDVPITVNSVNSIPIYENQSLSINRDLTYELFSQGLDITDPDSEEFQISFGSINSELNLQQNGIDIEAGNYIPISGITISAPYVKDYKINYSISDGISSGDLRSINIIVSESPYGENSQLSSLGGIAIDEFWSCKPGYSVVVESRVGSVTKTCEFVNEVPIANFTIGGLNQNSAKIGDTIYLNAETSTDDNLDSLTYDWNINSTEIKPSFVLSQALCINTCNITLTVTDNEEQSNSITKSFNIIESFEDLPENITEINYSNLIIQEGRTYNDEELAYLSLVKGSTITQSGKLITVDSTGLITKVESLQAQTATGSGEGPKYYVNDGSCSTSLGENTVNSPEDCKQKSNGFGIILIFTFSILLGIGGFIAWKKGIFSKVSTKSSPMPSYEVPEYSEPVSTNNIQNNSVNLSSMIKEKINQGYSEGEIKNYLLSHGYSETDIDNAINS
jgi:hypothetical protein